MPSSKPQSAMPVPPRDEPESNACWACGDRGAAQFCPACGRVQPPRPDDYFAFFGLERRLNLDTSELQQQMYRLSRRLHPDRYARATEQEKQWSLEQTSKLNVAYRTLSDAAARTAYLLQLEGMATAEQANKNSATVREPVPSDLLEEVFELKMQLERFHGGEHDHALRRELEEAKQDLEAKRDAIAAELTCCWNDWDALIAGQGSAAGEKRRRVLDRMAVVLQRWRYVDTLVREVAVALSS